MADEIVVAPVAGTPEYDAAMAAKVDDAAAKAAAAATETGIKAVKPDNVPEEFWNADTGTVNTEALLAAVAKPAPAATDEADPDAAKAAVTEKGFDYSVLQTEYNESGTLSDATYEKLAAAGFDRGVVDSYIEGQEAVAAQFISKAHEVAGGKEQFAQMQDWARAGLTAGELAAYNTAVEGTPEEALQAVTALRAKFETNYGKAPSLIGGTPATGAAAGYASKAEMVSDMRDARYQKDPAFRARVQSRVAASTAF